MERDPHLREDTADSDSMNISLQRPDTEAASQRLSEELPRIQAAVDQLELAKQVSRETLDRMISI